MARNADMVRDGEDALQNQEAQTQGGDFSSIPHIDQPRPREVKGFPVFSQMFHEIGTIAEVVDQINRISDFIAGRPSAPPAQPAQAEAQPAQAEAQPETQYAEQQQPAYTPPQSPVAQPQAPAPQPAQAPPVQEPVPEPVANQPTEEEMEFMYEELYQFVESVMQGAQEGRVFSVESGFVLISRAIDAERATDVLYRRAIYTRESSEDHGFASSVVLHSVNVAVYALKIGEGLGYNRNQLIDLGVSGLLHDVGMVTLPPDLFTKGRFSQHDIDILQQHPARGRDILAQLGEDYRWLAEVAYQEHERQDGSGYPQQLTGNEIHEYAKIIGVADLYAGLTRSRPDRRGMLPFEAVKEILQTRKQEFDPRVVRILLKTLSAFPVGSLVKLNSGAIGRVVDTDIDSPLRPVIAILFDPEGRPVQEAREIRLREHPILHITDTVTPEETGA